MQNMYIFLVSHTLPGRGGTMSQGTSSLPRPGVNKWDGARDDVPGTAPWDGESAVPGRWHTPPWDGRFQGPLLITFCRDIVQLSIQQMCC